MPQDYPLWFMRDLMCIILFFPIIGRLVNKYPKIMFILGLILHFIPEEFPLKTAMAWFFIGASLVKTNVRISYFDGLSFRFLSLIYVTGLAIVYLADNIYLHNIFILYSVLFIFRLSKVIYQTDKSRKIISKLSKWTFIIYVFHELTLTSCKKVFAKLIPSQDPLVILLEYLCIPLLVVMVCVIVGKGLRKTSLRFYRFVGGR